MQAQDSVRFKGNFSVCEQPCLSQINRYCFVLYSSWENQVLPTLLLAMPPSLQSSINTNLVVDIDRLLHQCVMASFTQHLLAYVLSAVRLLLRNQDLKGLSRKLPKSRFQPSLIFVAVNEFSGLRSTVALTSTPMLPGSDPDLRQSPGGACRHALCGPARQASFWSNQQNRLSCNCTAHWTIPLGNPKTLCISFL